MAQDATGFTGLQAWIERARQRRAQWDGTGPYPASAYEDAHHILSEYHAYLACAGMGADVAADVSGADVAVHAARLAAALSEVLVESAALQVIAAERTGAVAAHGQQMLPGGASH
jgi:hypothetical protein